MDSNAAPTTQRTVQQPARIGVPREADPNIPTLSAGRTSYADAAGIVAAFDTHFGGIKTAS